jgi:hypothetical protein
MQLLTEDQINHQYRTLTSHQKSRIMIIQKACIDAARGILFNTPKTPEVEAGINELRKLGEAAIRAIETEHLV